MQLSDEGAKLFGVLPRVVVRQIDPFCALHALLDELLEAGKNEEARALVDHEARRLVAEYEQRLREQARKKAETMRERHRVRCDGLTHRPFAQLREKMK